MIQANNWPSLAAPMRFALLLPLEWSISHEADFATALYISDKNIDNHKISWHYFHNEKSFF
jgi:hypothetical protein